jgi:hypothetical protein
MNEEYKYGVVAYHINGGPDKILHLCLYLEKPELNDIRSLTMELATDEEFGLVGHMDKVLFRMASEDELNDLEAVEIWRIEDL